MKSIFTAALLLFSLASFAQTDSTRRNPVQSIRNPELGPLLKANYEAGRHLRSAGGLLLGGFVVSTGSLVAGSLYNADYMKNEDDFTGTTIQLIGGTAGLVMSVIGYVKMMKAGKKMQQAYTTR